MKMEAYLGWMNCLRVQVSFVKITAIKFTGEYKIND